MDGGPDPLKGEGRKDSMRPLPNYFDLVLMYSCSWQRLLKKKKSDSAGATATPVERTASRWIKPGEQETTETEADKKTGGDEVEGRQCDGRGGKTSSSAPASCYSMATAASTGTSRQKSVRTTRFDIFFSKIRELKNTVLCFTIRFLISVFFYFCSVVNYISMTFGCWLYGTFIQI